ncbi:MAG TPA: SAM-dependent methyltransferase [Acidobacteriota bacterium]|nr:SAM-dependent methyltransferase [Acidobacteriota bacterium]
MPNAFNELIVKLAQDSSMREEFLRDPDSFLSKTNLSEGEKALIKTRRADLIRSYTYQKGRGSLTIVGTGIQLVGSATWEAIRCIESADRVLYAASEGATARWIESLNPRSESLDVLYKRGLPRMATYLETVEHILAFLRHGYRVCAVFYGHPGVFVFASHESIRRARKEGYAAEMLPGVSAEDCLFADLQVDPQVHGYQGYEATDFLIRNRNFDPGCALVLWQIGVVGELGYKQAPNVAGLRVLMEHLCRFYDPSHEVIVYEAAQYPITEPRIDRVPLGKLPEATITAFCTLYVPPRS